MLYLVVIYNTVVKQIVKKQNTKSNNKVLQVFCVKTNKIPRLKPWAVQAKAKQNNSSQFQLWEMRSWEIIKIKIINR